jgi:hypothetical protein
VNDGLIDATAQGVLLIDPANFKNAGIMDVANGGTVILSTAFTNLAGGTLTGGRFLVGAGGTLDLSNNADLGTLASNLSLSGTNSVVQWLNTSTNQEVSFDTVFSTIDSGATLALLDGRDLTTTNTVTDEGLLSLGGGTLSAGGLAVHSAASVSGAGAILGSVALATNSALSAAGGTLSVTGAVTGTGELKANADASLTIGGSASAQSAVVEAGGLLSVAGTFSAGGITLAGSGDGLAFGTAGSVAGAISGFGSGDTIDITSQTLSSVVWTQKSSSGGSLSLIGAGGGSIGVLVLSGSYTQANFSVASDLHHIDFVAATASVSVLQDIASPSAAVAAPTPDAAYVALHSPAVADVLHVPATHT